MNLKEFRAFLLLFGLDESAITALIGERMIEEVNGQLFLTANPLQESQVAGGMPIFISLKGTVLPTIPLLSHIAEQVGTLEVKTRKQALQFTYGKSLSRQLLTYEGELVPQRYYLITFNGYLLGYAQYDADARKCYNRMHVGAYLKES